MKILILTQNITDLNTIDLGLQIAKVRAASIGLDLEITIQQTTNTFTVIQNQVSEISQGGFCINPTDILKATPSGYRVSCLVFDPTKFNPEPTNPSCNDYRLNNCIPIQIPTNWYTTYPDVFATYFLHELCHAGYFFAKEQGFPLVDVTHNQQQYPEWQQKQPIDYYLYLLNKLLPYFTVPQPTQPVAPTVVITRETHDCKETLGTLVAVKGGATFTCKTLELPWLNNQHNISCIPTGTYTVKYTFSPRMLKFTYEVQNVPNRSGIRIHVGNYYSDLLGCIALGNGLTDINHDGEIDVVNSKITITAFEGFMGKTSFTLIIK